MSDKQEMRITADISPEELASQIEAPTATVNGAAIPIQQPPKRGRGRPPGSVTKNRARNNSRHATARVNGAAVPVEPSKTPEEIQAEIMAEAATIAPVVHQTIGIFVDGYLPPDKPYSEEMALGLCAAAVPVFRKHSDRVGPYAAEIGLVLVAASQGIMLYKLMKQHQAQLAEQQ